MSAAWLFTIFRHERNLSSQEQCMTAWNLSLRRPYRVSPGLMDKGQTRSWCLQHRSEAAYPPNFIALSVLHPGPHHFVPGILTRSLGRVFSSFAPAGFQPIGGSISTSTASWSVAFLRSTIERRGTIVSSLISEMVSWRGSSWPASKENLDLYCYYCGYTCNFPTCLIHTYLRNYATLGQ